jgi:hypothetical protein
MHLHDYEGRHEHGYFYMLHGMCQAQQTRWDICICLLIQTPTRSQATKTTRDKTRNQTALYMVIMIAAGLRYGCS